MKKLVLLFLHIVPIVCISQTKLISHKSHSGSNADFKIAMEANLFDIGASNFGDVPYREVKNSSLDTVIYVSKGKAVMITSEYCKQVEKRRKQEEDKTPGTFWKAGKDTVFNHPLFSKNHSLDSIKMVLKTQYHFQNEVDKVVFIGFDNKVKKYKKENRKYKKSGFFVPAGNDTDFPSKFVFVVALALVSILVAFFTWKANAYETLVSE